jgi:cyclopropane fatty-acyl-phospholipid synthase-like methyltransferase
MFNSKDVAAYYDSTQIHYEQWWDLSNSLALHYGIWDKSTKNFKQAIINTNRLLMELSEIKPGERILDAGCGVGGAAIFLANQYDVKITGITLSEKQLDFANDQINGSHFETMIDFHLKDYCDTGFPNESFDIVWACESISSAPDKKKFLKEAYRLLAKGGRLVLCDYFLTQKGINFQKNWMSKWEQSWALSKIEPLEQFENEIHDVGFNSFLARDYTSQINKSAKRMYYAALLAALPSETYKIFNPNVSHFARNHYKSGIYQYKTLRAGLWNYNLILAKK